MATIPLNTASKQPYQSASGRQRSQSRGRDENRQSRPTTPLRASSRSRETSRVRRPEDAPIDALLPAFEELDDAMAQLNDNFFALQQMHESIAKFNENFASLLYGMNMNAFCVDFSESPMLESFNRAQEESEELSRMAAVHIQKPDHHVADTTFMTNDTFVEQPAPSSKMPKKTSSRGQPTRGGRGAPQVSRSRGSGIARGRGAGTGSRHGVK